MSFSVIHYSHDTSSDPIMERCFRVLELSVQSGGDGELISVAWEPLTSRTAMSIKHEPIHESNPHAEMYSQILTGLYTCSTNLVFLAEHDVLYPSMYFQEVREVAGNFLTYCTDFLYLNRRGFFVPIGLLSVLSQLCGPRQLLIDEFNKLLTLALECDLTWAEPRIKGREHHVKKVTVPCVDIRHGGNMTGYRTPRSEKDYMKDHPFWGSASRWLQ
jgi:hypothetical protein